MHKVWFISDTHFHHNNVLYFHPKRREAAGISISELTSCSEIENAGEKKEAKKAILLKHDEWLMNLWNSTIKREDVVYILGDFSLGNKEYTEKILNKLHGKKYLIRGNHDKSCQGLERYFEWVGDVKEVKFTHNQFSFIDENEAFCVEMCHFPFLSWNRRPHGTVCAHGHCHGSIDNWNKESKELRVDVGLDGELANYNFISLEKLYEHYRNIIESEGCKTFQEYVDKLMEIQGFRA